MKRASAADVHFDVVNGSHPQGKQITIDLTRSHTLPDNIETSTLQA